MSRLEDLAGRFLRLHDTVYRRTNGRIGRRLPGGFAPALLLHTVGAKTGQPRTTTLSYSNDGNDYLVVASNGGGPRNPGWYHNLRAHPRIEINLGPKRLPTEAHVVLPDDPDYARLFKLCDDENNGRYSAYQELTSRPIPVIRLTPLVAPRLR